MTPEDENFTFIQIGFVKSIVQRVSPELPQVTVHQCNKCTVNETQNANTDCDSTKPDRMNIAKEITKQKTIPTLISSAFSSFPPCPCLYLTSLTSQHRTSIHTHTPLKTENLKWLKQWILESRGRNHSQHTTSEMTRNNLKILPFQVTVTPLHKLNTITL
jgi:hypothetical protein